VTTVGPRPIFVLGAARTGTTLLQRLLNSYDDVLVWGEHAGFVEHVARAFYRAWDDPSFFKDVAPLAEILAGSRPEETWQGWMTWTSREDWLRTFRGLLDALFVPAGLPGKRWWGFKEIRYMATRADRTLEFLGALYPDALFAFIVRHPLNAIASVRRIPEGAHRLDELQRLCAGWESRYRSYHAWHAADPSRSFWVVYEDLIREEGDVRRLVAALGHEIGEPQRAVLRSGEGRWSSFKDEAVNERWRRLPAAWLAVIAATLGPLCADLGYELPPSARLYGLAGRPLVRALRRRDGVRP
jgi:hypothetical protein